MFDNYVPCSTASHSKIKQYFSKISFYSQETYNISKDVCIWNAVLPLSPLFILEKYLCPLRTLRLTASEVGCDEEENCSGIENVDDELMTFVF